MNSALYLIPLVICAGALWVSVAASVDAVTDPIFSTPWAALTALCASMSLLGVIISGIGLFAAG